MGYTHYWYRKDKEVSYDKMRALVNDFLKLIPELNKAGIKLAGGCGTGEPEIGIDGVWFNGNENCGHAQRDLGITWPSPTAFGVKENGEVKGGWFAGALLEQRTCGGDCSHETLHFPRVLGKDDMQETEDGYFACTKTAYKPYDVAVTAFLILAKHHLGDAIKVSTDGEPKDWEDGRMLCEAVLGYPRMPIEFASTTGNLVLA